jgi:protocatechuate 3,4-dioxygenase beta subunit
MADGAWAPDGTHPPLLYLPYQSTRRRAPSQPLVAIPERLADVTAPVYEWWTIGERDNDLTTGCGGVAHGQRIIVAGRLLDNDARPIAGALIEVWQANAAGRYHHAKDDHPAPLDPNFTGAGRVTTDAEGRYEFTTIRPGAYPWRNHDNAWRPAHIHFSVFGHCFQQRLVTQMYFPGDPMFAYDPIFQSVPDDRARERLVARYDLSLTRPEWALGYWFDIVVGGRTATPFEGSR